MFCQKQLGLPAERVSDTVRVVSIVGKSNSGKTTLLEALIPVLTKRGYKVGTIKHDVHGFKIDYEGKDSYRHRQAGALAVGLSAPSGFALVKQVQQELTAGQIVAEYMADMDIVLTEGYKTESWPKIEVLADNERLTTKENLLAVVSRQKRSDIPVPTFTWDKIQELADLIIEKSKFVKNKKKKGENFV